MVDTRDGAPSAPSCHTHCDHWPEACCWCAQGLSEHEATWQDVEWTPRRIVIQAADIPDATS